MGVWILCLRSAVPLLLSPALLAVDYPCPCVCIAPCVLCARVLGLHVHRDDIVMVSASVLSPCDGSLKILRVCPSVYPLVYRVSRGTRRHNYLGSSCTSRTSAHWPRAMASARLKKQASSQSCPRAAANHALRHAVPREMSGAPSRREQRIYGSDYGAADAEASSR